MAQKVQVLLVDDLDGATADETVSFSLDGVSYEIDLSSKNAAKMRDSFASYVGAARRVGGRSRGGRGRSSSRAGTETAAIRTWAKEQGLKVSDRGRIPAEVVAKYEAAHS
jgi:hypothetical protein